MGARKLGATLPPVSARAPRRYVPSQLSPIAEAFGFVDEDGGERRGWGVEWRPARKKRRDWWPDVPPWPCAGLGCEQLIRWHPRGRLYRKFCSKRCAKSVHYKRERERETPEQRAARLKYGRAWRAAHREYARQYAGTWRPRQAARWSRISAGLSEQLRAAGIRQAEVARRTGVSPSMVSRILTGDTTSRRVIDMARQMIAERAAARAEAPAFPPYTTTETGTLALTRAHVVGGVKGAP